MVCHRPGYSGDHPTVGGGLSFSWICGGPSWGWWVTALGMLGDHLGDGGLPSFGSWVTVTIHGKMVDHILYGV